MYVDGTAGGSVACKLHINDYYSKIDLGIYKCMVLRTLTIAKL